MKQLFALLALVALTACSKSGADKFKEDFLRTCLITSSGNEAGCECIIDKLSEHYSDDELARFNDASLIDPNMPEISLRAAMECRNP